MFGHEARRPHRGTDCPGIRNGQVRPLFRRPMFRFAPKRSRKAMARGSVTGLFEVGIPPGTADATTSRGDVKKSLDVRPGMPDEVRRSRL